MCTVVAIIVQVLNRIQFDGHNIACFLRAHVSGLVMRAVCWFWIVIQMSVPEIH